MFKIVYMFYGKENLEMCLNERDWGEGMILVVCLII